MQSTTNYFDSAVNDWSDGRKSKSATKQRAALNRNPWICDTCGLSTDSPGDGCECGLSSFHRRRIFSLSLGDWLDPEVPIEWLVEMLDSIRQADQCTHILCTKRPELFFDRLNETGSAVRAIGSNWICDWMDGKAPPNIWLLTSVENQEQADKRIPELLKIPAAVRGLSCEPLLGPVDLTSVKQEVDPGFFGDCLKWYHRGHCHKIEGIRYPTIDWVIVGGESAHPGQPARPCNIAWIRDIKNQCAAACVPCFVKQLGSNPYADVLIECHVAALAGLVGIENRKFHLKHRSGGDPAEWPEDLRAQQFPTSTIH